MSRILFSSTDLECAIRLFIACICGGIIGFERTRRNKGAGLRTHIIVAVGAALFVIVSKYGFIDVVSQDGVQVDVARVASNVVTGVGFLGAGLINMRGDSIQGLTTAAGVWADAAIGLAIGCGLYSVGLTGTALIIIVQFILHQKNVIAYDNVITSSIVVNMEDDPKAFYEFCEFMKKKGIEISGNHIRRHRDRSLTYTLDVHMPRDITSKDILEIVKECDFVKAIEM